MEELGFDDFVNYNVPDFAGCLRKAAPNGIDCNFDNVSSVVFGNFEAFWLRCFRLVEGLVV